ncbi:SAM-dependent methyltransferase [Nocardia donostiensis]|uniref:S-adenosyl-L-methionine-dependent methyltransferase n=1 Tax=Nocardia donostiensis TaxID=1538463 RepID=A0A1W0B9Z8_9NOCA|nr:SAM-dependent methyltransferase [Nocardia donostiensis]OQS12806.1 SAM-dependent methyltransferase [Nocardia donostiensis]OQS19359.1 SAM-dependent methyltransferase [Nocardia donostiensis]
MRTDGDVWDIVTSVGLTALGVATFRALESAHPDPLIRDDYAALFVHAAGEQHFLDLLDDPPKIGDTPLIPGFMGFRTKFFDDFFLSAAADGGRQAVILAAGLDARAYRLDWPTGTTVFEIDQPKVLEFKERVLTEHAATPKADRRPVAVDLREDWPAALVSAGLNPEEPTAWSAEGLLPYLPGTAQDALFEHIDELSVPGSHLGVESAPTGAETKNFAALESKYFDKNPFGDIDPTELFYRDERTDPEQWLLGNGWSVRAASSAELAAAYDRAVPELPDEIEQEWQRPRYLSAVRGPR